jgi:hypothetical protein
MIDIDDIDPVRADPLWLPFVPTAFPLTFPVPACGEFPSLEVPAPATLPPGTADPAFSTPTPLDGPTTNLPDSSASGITGVDSEGTLTALITTTALGALGALEVNDGRL